MPADIGAPLNYYEHLPLGITGLAAFQYYKELGLDLVTADHFTEIGTGGLDIQSIIDAANRYTKASHIVLEQDFTKYPELESVKISFDAVHKFDGVDWT